MGTKKMLIMNFLLLGEVVIVLGFLRLGKDLTTEILILNIIVSSLIFPLYFIDLLTAKVDIASVVRKTTLSPAFRWAIVIFYSMAAISVMVVSNVIYSFDFIPQLIVQIILFLLLVGGLYMSKSIIDRKKLIKNKE